MKSEEKVRMHTIFLKNMLHYLTIQINFFSLNKSEIWKWMIHTNVIYSLATTYPIWNLKMDALTSFIVVIIAITIQFSLYAIKRLQEPLEPKYLLDKNSKKIKNYIGKFWKNAEITNGRLAMIGFLALIINYGFFGWIIPGFI